MFLLGTHYRSPINYTVEQLNVASDRLYYTYQVYSIFICSWVHAIAILLLCSYELLTCLITCHIRYMLLVYTISYCFEIEVVGLCGRWGSGYKNVRITPTSLNNIESIYMNLLVNCRRLLDMRITFLDAGADESVRPS